MKITKNELKQIIKEELKATLSENEAVLKLAKNLQDAGLKGAEVMGAAEAVIAAQGRVPAGADKILALAMKQAKDGVFSEDLIDNLKQIKARPQVAKKPAEKKPTTKPTTKTKRVSGTPPPHKMETVVKDGYVIATATTKDGVVGTGKAKIRPATGRHGAESAAKLRAQVALMDAVSQRKRTARGGVPPQ